MKIASIKKIGRQPVYDLTLNSKNYDMQHYVLKNGVVTHNTGIMYSANQVFIITKSQEKEGTELAGWKFTINIEKSRYVKEKSKLPFTVMYDDGIQKWTAIFDFAMEAGFIVKPKVGWYQLVNPETGEISEKNYRQADVINNDEYFEKLICNQEFKTFVEHKFKLAASQGKQISSEISEEFDEEVDIDE
jgi:hypothetical protein